MCSDRKIRICFVISSLANSGPVSVLFNIVQHLDKSQLEPYIITLYRESEFSRLEDFEKTGITILKSKLPKKKRVVAYFWLKKNIRNLKPDIIHSHCLPSLNYLKHIRGTFKKAHTIHMHPLQFFFFKYGRIKGRLMANFYFEDYNKMDKIIVCANHLMGEIKTNETSKTVVIRNGVDTSFFRAVSSEEKVALKREAGYENKVVYFMNNRLSPEKNNAFIVNNFPSNINVHLIIVGDGKAGRKAFLGKKEKPNITWVKYTDHVLQFLRVSDYYVSASRSEGLPMAILEAMSCGVSPILSDIPAHREIVSSIKNPFLFSLDSKEELQSIFKRTGGLTIQPSSKIRQYVKDSFSANAMAQLHEEMFRGLSI